MITVKRLRTGKWESLVRIGGLIPMTETFISEDMAREWAHHIDRELREARARLLHIALGNRGKPKGQKQRPPQDIRGLITPAIERFLEIYGCAGELPLEQASVPRRSWPR
jgi:hypothetical protein